MNNSEITQQTIDVPSQTEPKKSRWKRLLVVVLVIVLVTIIVGRAVQQALDEYEQNLAYVMQCIDYLNEPVNESELIENPILPVHLTTFTSKANAAQFEIYKDGKVDFSQQAINLNYQLNLTGNEFGAFLNEVIKNNSDYAVQLFEIKELTISEVVKNNLPVKFIKTVAMLNLGVFEELLSDKKLSNFPTQIYISSVSQTKLTNNIINLEQSFVLINQLDPDRNQEVLNFLSSILTTGSGEFSVIELVTLLVIEIMEDLAQKTNSTIQFSSSTIRFVPN